MTTSAGGGAADDDLAVEETLRSRPDVADARVVRDASGRRRALVVPRLQRSAASDESARVWARIFDTQYAKGRGTADPAFDTSAWNSSYTRTAMTAAEMEEWTASTVNRVRLHAPARPDGWRILELGCGTGLLLHRLLPQAKRYVGIDASAEGLRTIETAVARAGGGAAARTSLSKGDALDAARAAEGPFDVVVVNSVAQYFPTVEYLLALIDESFRLLAPDGTLFLGDLRNARLQRAFDASVVLPRASREQDVGIAKKQLAARTRSEHETLYDPELFHSLHRLHPEMGAVVTAARRGVFDNEMNRFRYDAVLKKGAVRRCGDVAAVRWSELPSELAAERHPAVTAGAIPNTRVARWALLADGVENAAPGETCGDVLDSVEADLRGRPATADPEELVAEGQRLGWIASADPGAGSVPWEFSAAFLRPSASPDAVWLSSSLLRRGATPPVRWAALSNRLLPSEPPKDWVAAIVRGLEERSPGLGSALEISAVEPLTFKLLAAGLGSGSFGGA